MEILKDTTLANFNNWFLLNLNIDHIPHRNSFYCIFDARCEHYFKYEFEVDLQWDSVTPDVKTNSWFQLQLRERFCRYYGGFYKFH